MVEENGRVASSGAKQHFPYDQMQTPFGYRTRWWLPHPPLTMKDVRDVGFTEDDFLLFEEVLSRPLVDDARTALMMACGEFVFTVLFRNEVRPERRYQHALSKELSEVHAPLMAILRFLDAEPQNAASVTPGTEVHARQWIMAEWGKAVVAMRDFEQQLSQTIRELDHAPRKGADGYYELKYLLHNLYLIAEYVGASLSINSHSDLAGEASRSEFKPTRLVRFCSTVLEKNLERAPETLLSYKRTAKETAGAMARLKSLNKAPHKLVPDLEQIRSERVKE